MKPFTQRWREASDEADDYRAALAAQTERADRLQAEVEESAYRFMNERNSLAAELDAVRKERDAAIKQGANWEKSTYAMESQRDAAQAKCAELEKGIKSVYEYVNDGPDPISLWTVALKLEAILTPAPPEEKRP